MRDRMVLGVMGHVDHGKTALVRALTGMETDRLPEEKRRGISIALGFAHFTVGGATVDLIDMPGHERFVRTLVAGAAGIDAVLLVVAANEGLKPQTLEHADIAALLGIRRAVVAISKADLATPAQLAAVAAHTAELLGRLGLSAAAPVAVSAQRGTGLAALQEAIAGLLPDLVAPADTGAPYLPVDRVFSVAGHGTVVTGTLRGGTLAAGQELLVLPAGLPARVRGVQVHGARVAIALPGQRVAANLRGPGVEAVRAGMALSEPGLLRPASWLSVMLHATASAPALPTGALLQVLVGTQEVTARLRLLDRDALQPQQATLAQLRCMEPVVAPARQHLILRLASPPLTVAGGLVLDNETARLRRRDAGVLSRLGALAAASEAELVRLEAEASGAAGTTLRRLAALAGVGPRRAAEWLQGSAAVVLRDGTVTTRPALDDMAARVVRLLEGAAEATLPLGRLRSALPQAGAGVLDEVLRRLAAAGMLRQEAGAVRLNRQEHDAKREAQAGAVSARVAAALRQGGLTPPDPAALGVDTATRQALAQLVRAGVAVRTTDRVLKRDLLFHREAIELARQRLAPLLAGAGLKVSEVGVTLGISRKYSVPLLEYLDSVKFTRRVEDRRVLGAGLAG